MMMKKMRVVIGVIGALTLASWAAEPQFEEVPAAAFKWLKAEKGKPIRTGMVFVNGKYLNPPYVLVRAGTALFVTQDPRGKKDLQQITNQIIFPWKSFLATQSGAAAVFAHHQPPPSAAPVQSRTVQPRTVVQDVDDLFDDTPAPESPAPAAPSAPDPAVSAAAAAETAAAVAALEASFVPNEQTKQKLKSINDRRSYFDRKLREGNVIFFGVRYSPVTVDPSLVRTLLDVLPQAIREANDGAQLSATLRSKGISYLSREVCDDLVENRVDYSRIDERRKEMEREDEVRKILRQGVR